MNGQTRANLLPTGSSSFEFVREYERKCNLYGMGFMYINIKNGIISDNVSSIAYQFLVNLVQLIFYIFYNPTPEAGVRKPVTDFKY